MLRSLQSVIADSPSTPTTRALMRRPYMARSTSALCQTSSTAYTKPAQPARMSEADETRMPRTRWSWVARLGSRIQVFTATRISSISSAATPASSSAFCEALTAMSRIDSRPSSTRRDRMPVRRWIHSSLVSTNCSRSAFVSSVSGTYAPLPTYPMRGSFATSALPLAAGSAVPVVLGGGDGPRGGAISESQAGV